MPDPHKLPNPLTVADIDQIDFAKGGGLVPAVVQDADTLQVLMLGYMNVEALKATLQGGLVTFWSRSKNRLWKKGVLRMYPSDVCSERCGLSVRA